MIDFEVYSESVWFINDNFIEMMLKLPFCVFGRSGMVALQASKLPNISPRNQNGK